MDKAPQGRASAEGKTPSRIVAARLHVILARNAAAGVIFRRGPSRWVQIIKWDTATDRLEPGHWFRGRIYERRCDLSPDGRRMIYFAFRISTRTLERYTASWTAVSEPPWLTPVALWPKGDAWHGGGLFLDDGTIWLNHKPEQAAPDPGYLPRGFEVIPNPDAEGEDWPIYFKRLDRDGWALRREGWVSRRRGWVGEWVMSEERPEASSIYAVIHEKTQVNGRQVLTSVYMTDWVALKHLDAYALADASRGRRGFLEGATWADWDQQGRLVFARDGKLFAGEFEDSGRIASAELADLNHANPEDPGPSEWKPPS